MPIIGSTPISRETCRICCKLLELLDDHDDFLAELAPEQGILHEERILVAVADDEALGVAMDGQRGDQLGLAAGLDAEMERRAGIHDLLDHFAELVDLDREDAAIGVAIIRLGDGVGEGLIDRLHAMAEEILKAEDDRESEAALLGLVDEFHDVDGSLGRLRREHRRYCPRSLIVKYPMPQRSIL